MSLLSIVIPTIPGRESLLSRCLHSITEQDTDGVEVLVVEGPGKQGDKINAGVAAAAGMYVTMVDDDDWLSADYLSLVLPLCAEGVDYVGLKILWIQNGRYAGVSVTSGESRSWDGPVRLPVPKGVTRAGIAREVRFGNHYTADRDWAAEVSRRVKSWAFVDRELYVYDYWDHAYGGGSRDVGRWPHDVSRIRRIEV